MSLLESWSVEKYLCERHSDQLLIMGVSVDVSSTGNSRGVMVSCEAFSLSCWSHWDRLAGCLSLKVVPSRSNFQTLSNLNCTNVCLPSPWPHRFAKSFFQPFSIGTVETHYCVTIEVFFVPEFIPWVHPLLFCFPWLVGLEMLLYSLCVCRYPWVRALVYMIFFNCPPHLYSASNFTANVFMFFAHCLTLCLISLCAAWES